MAVSLAAHRLGKPVRLVMDLATTLEVSGKRLPFLARYKATVGPDLKLSSVVIKLFCDSGSNYNESTADVAVAYAKGAYSSPAWRITPMAVLTDTASNTYCRSDPSSSLQSPLILALGSCCFCCTGVSGPNRANLKIFKI